MGTFRQQVAIFACVLAAACGGDDEPASSSSPCKAFAAAPEPTYVLEPYASIAGVTRVAGAYALSGNRIVELPSGATKLETEGALDLAARGSNLWVLRTAGAGLEVVKDGAKVLTIDAATVGAITVGPDDVVWVAAGDKVFKNTEVYATGFAAPTGIAVDGSDVWVVDKGELYRVRENSRFKVLGDAGLLSNVVVHRGGVSPLAGKPILGNPVSAVIPFAASGPAVNKTLGVEGSAVGRGPNDELFVVTPTAIMRVRDVAPTAPKLLSETGCLGEPTGAVSYDVASPLWSDGAQKSRAVVSPSQPRTLADGDLKFPVGTVAIKTFSLGGKKVETRLLIQHSLENWVGYSYAWNDAGTDAELVIGNRQTSAWYFPSTSDCTACHTPAAGYTLGLESRQVKDSKLAVDHGKYPPLQGARGYLHANCSMCHREGSSTGGAEMDLRFDTPLATTGICNPPKVSDLGIVDARIVAPKEPARSVLLQRMKATDDTRMPKVASHVVDEAGVALITSWIDSLVSCP